MDAFAHTYTPCWWWNPLRCSQVRAGWRSGPSHWHPEAKVPVRRLFVSAANTQGFRSPHDGSPREDSHHRLPDCLRHQPHQAACRSLPGPRESLCTFQLPWKACDACRLRSPEPRAIPTFSSLPATSRGATGQSNTPTSCLPAGSRSWPSSPRAPLKRSWTARTRSPAPADSVKGTQELWARPTSLQHRPCTCSCKDPCADQWTQSHLSTQAQSWNCAQHPLLPACETFVLIPADLLPLGTC